MIGFRDALLASLDLPLAAVRADPSLHRVNGASLVVRGAPRSASEVAIWAPSFIIELRPSLRQAGGHAVLRRAKVLARRRVLGDQSVDQFERQGLQDQATSIANATFAACKVLGLPVVTTGTGVKVERVDPDGPSATSLSPGDVIEAIDGVAVTTVEALYSRLLARSSPEVEVTVRTGQRGAGPGGSRSVRVSPVATDGRPWLGVVASTHRLRVDLPVDVEVDLDAGTAGPSAGLALALSIVDALTPPAGLASGRSVGLAATGAIDTLGRVHPVGGVGLKTRSVVAAGFDRFLVPTGNEAEARAAAAGCRLQVIGVEAIEDACEVLAAER